MENQQPQLKSLPLGIKQKRILATCNYVARKRGVGKLMLITEAKKLCPDLVVVEGEDLSLFRDVSKKIHALLRCYSWNGKVERLGLDEIFLDVTDVIAYNVELLNRNALAQSFFCLSPSDPEKGFEFDATSFAGCVWQRSQDATQFPRIGDQGDITLRTRLLLGSHLARYLRLQIEEVGYTSSCGISTNKLLAKLVGNKNKPRNQTALLALCDDDVYAFMDEHHLRKVPGIGSRTTRLVDEFVRGKEATKQPAASAGPDDIYAPESESSVTVGAARTDPRISAPALERLLGGPGAERGQGSKVWAFLHGVDDADVKPARDVPTQISIEDTYPKGLRNVSEVRHALTLISTSLLRRMHVDLVVDTEDASQAQTTQASPVENTGKSKKWLAYPKTIRLTTRLKTGFEKGIPSSDTTNPQHFASRTSRSCPLPGFVFGSGITTSSPFIASNTAQTTTTTPTESIVQRLVTETLMPMFLKLHPVNNNHANNVQGNKSSSSPWTIGLLNVCVTNMVGAGVDTSGSGTGRDIAGMFRRQKDTLREFSVYDVDDKGVGGIEVEEREPRKRKRAEEEHVEPAGEDSLESRHASSTAIVNDIDMGYDGDEQQRNGGEDDEDCENKWVSDEDDEEGAGSYYLPGHGSNHESRGSGEQCPLCGHSIPLFAMAAHERFHSMEIEDE